MPAQPQTTDCVLLIRPRSFCVNPQTATTNRLQSTATQAAELADRAAAEVDEVAACLSDAGVTTLVFDDTPEPPKPDAVFPNNWVSFHSDGRVVLYPMHAQNRRAERRPDIIADLVERGFEILGRIDLSPLEAEGQALEGTGSLVLDRPRRVAYAALSPRTTRVALDEFARRTGYRVHSFRTDYRGTPVYHTNVMLALGNGFAVVCDEVINHRDERAVLLDDLAASGRQVLRIRSAQMTRFAANLLELDTPSGPVIALSAAAREAFLPGQRDQLGEFGRLLSVPLPTIETGGGSLRCMLAEVFLPRAGSAGG